MKSPLVVRSEITISEPLAVHDEPIEEPPLLELKAVMVNGSVAVEDDDEDEKGINELESAWNRIKKLDRTRMDGDSIGRHINRPGADEWVCPASLLDG